MNELRYSEERNIKVSIDFTEDELGDLHAIVVRSKLSRESPNRKISYTTLEQRLKDIVNEVLK
ncbi:hypothetical protein SEA_WEASELS2_12 [Rhodococcus phage Weasels2]|uniref:Uncharacterized protein n=1 Tax=Rhodococcus phage Weasels2 TaxID=1897437 RepID=A0A1I9S9Z6_9CAUD|nr:hypothetical protein FDH04_gp012 [Rhodococcus phage Weasels2]AOZ63602.1 hypothetical protein SEA_WEASELS2_12 [Rhodococcus phage Weasels2]